MLKFCARPRFYNFPIGRRANAGPLKESGHPGEAFGELARHIRAYFLVQDVIDWFISDPRRYRLRIFREKR